MLPTDERNPYWMGSPYKTSILRKYLFYSVYHSVHISLAFQVRIALEKYYSYIRNFQIPRNGTLL